MTTSRRRTVYATATSVVIVLVPAVAAVGAAQLAWQLTVDGSAGREWTAALLRLACLASAVSLVWAALAAAMGVREGWRRAAPPAAPSTAPRGTGTGTTGTRGARATTTGSTSAGGRHGGVLTATVAALVVAALTSPTAAAAHGPATAPPAATADQDPQQPAEERSATPGSWTALAATSPGRPATSDEDLDAFLAPRTVDPTTAALVTGTATRDDLAGASEVVVLAGDSLWSLASARLGPDADDAEVAEAWPRWWETNRDVIGDDPHLLLPGQRLVVPTS